MTTLTSGRPAALILRFTLPLIAGNVFQQVYIIADTVIVGRTLGVEALAAVGCTGAMTWLVIGFAFGLTNGLAIPTAQRFGAGDGAGVRRSFTNGAILAMAVSIVLTCLAVPLTRTALQLLQTPPQVLDDATGFATVILLGLPANVAFNHVCSALRALGDSRTPFYIYAVTTVMNVALDFWFILGLHGGVPGAAAATVVSQAFWAAAGALYLYARAPMLRFRRQDWRIDPATMRELCRMGFPMAFQASIITIGAIALQPALNRLGTDAVAAYAACGKIDAIAVAPFVSLGVAISTFAAQNLGAGLTDRVRRGVRDSTLISVGFALVVGFILILTGSQLMGLFVTDPSPRVVDLGQTYLLVNCTCYVALGTLVVLRNALQGLGNALVPTIAGCGELIARLVAAFALAAPLGFLGVCIAGPLAWLGSLIPLVIAWYRWLAKPSRGTAGGTAPATAIPDRAEPLPSSAPLPL